MSNQIPRRSSLALLGPESLDLAPREHVKEIPLASVQPNRRQVRTAFAEESIQELADSIGKHGLLQPIVVRRLEPESATAAPAGVLYELIAGERRWRAHQLLGKETIR